MNRVPCPLRAPWQRPVWTRYYAFEYGGHYWWGRQGGRSIGQGPQPPAFFYEGDPTWARYRHWLRGPWWGHAESGILFFERDGFEYCVLEAGASAARAI